jgi:hypothetical protein
MNLLIGSDDCAHFFICKLNLTVSALAQLLDKIYLN